jgi:uncharacterized protein
MQWDEEFVPQPWARNPHLQSIFASLGLRTWGPNPMRAAAEPVIVDGGNGVRLLGALSTHSQATTRGLTILIHGWEGSADSAYILNTGRYLFEKGYDVFRLNLRDHGESHHLNDGLFHGALIDEVAHAVEQVAALAGASPCWLIGFSLGGNFALRIALAQAGRPIPNLRRVICISPPLDPYKATLAIDGSLPVYRRYFLKKWKRSLLRKQSLFPGKYAFDHLMGMQSCMEITEALMEYYPDYPTYRDYFNRYTLLGDTFRDLSLPVTIFASADDPVVPIEDLYALEKNPCLDVFIQRWGGHCGFLAPFPFGCWYERKIGALLATDRD